MRPLVRLGRRLGRDAGVYAAGFAVTLGLSLVSVAILTRYLDPAEFGELAVLLFFAALLTVLYNLGFLQGSLAWVFGSSGEEEADEAAAGEGPSDRRRALGGAIVLTAAIATLGTILLLPAAGALTSILGLPGAGTAVAIAAVSGGLGALWRLVSNVPRLERRPRLFVAFSALRPVAVLAVTIPLVASGHGVEGAVAGVAIGTAVAVAVGLVAIRGSYRPALPFEDVRRILRVGLPFVPVIVAFWVIQNVDLYVLSKYASEDEVGLYRLASRVGAIVSYFVSAFLMAWGPLTLTSVFMAAAKEHGPTGVGARLTTYYAIFGFGLLVALAVGADLMVRIAPPSYSDAAGLIPVLGAGFLAYGAFVVVYRAARFPRRRVVYAWLAAASATLFLAAVVVLTSAFGAYGAAAAAILAFGAGALGIIWKSQRGPEPMRFEGRRIAAAAGLAVACIAASRTAAGLPGEWHAVVDAIALLAYPLAALAAGIVPRSHLGPLLEVAAGLLPTRGVPAALGEGVARLAPDDRSLLAAVLRDGADVPTAARRLALREDEAGERLLRSLAAVASIDPPPCDPTIVHFLFARRSVAERDAMARGLWEAGVDPDALDLLEEACAWLRAAPEAAWQAPGATRDPVPRV